MIYYFSGTGNSAHIARIAAEKLGTVAVDITDAGSFPPNGDEQTGSDTTLGLVMPVYAWGLPDVVEKFIGGKQPDDVEKPNNVTLPDIVDIERVGYTWCILTHGDDMGYADEILRGRLKQVGLRLDAVFSLAMPNTYVCLPGFDVDANDLADKKLRESTEAMDAICASIAGRERCTKVTRGAMPFVKTYILRPLFNAVLVSDRYFHTDDSRCNRCGRCEKACPLHNITASKLGVVWHGNCTGCLRCYHSCPCNAIQFGWFTRSKGQKKQLL